MRAIVLSAGQGRRLLPLTKEVPKCLLAVDGEERVLEFQLEALARCGIERATVMVGFGAERVESFIASHSFPGLTVDTFFNPLYSTTDNLVTCWLARGMMNEDFLLLNGDTLFEDRALRTALESPGPITVTIDKKSKYDDDDMKVSLDERGRLLAIGKTLSGDEVNAESIGMLLFRDSGPKTWVDALERAVRQPEALKAWYLSVINSLAQESPVETACIEGLWWREIDSPEDLAEVRSSLASDDAPSRNDALDRKTAR